MRLELVALSTLKFAHSSKIGASCTSKPLSCKRAAKKGLAGRIHFLVGLKVLHTITRECSVGACMAAVGPGGQPRLRTLCNPCLVGGTMLTPSVVVGRETFPSEQEESKAQADPKAIHSVVEFSRSVRVKSQSARVSNSNDYTLIHQNCVLTISASVERTQFIVHQHRRRCILHCTAAG